MAQTTYIAQQRSSKFNYTIDVLRLHQRWGWFSNVCDFYMRLGEDKFLAWYKIFEIEKKKCSFSKSDFGITGLETTFPICNSILKDEVSIEKIIELLSFKL